MSINMQGDQSFSAMDGSLVSKTPSLQHRTANENLQRSIHLLEEAVGSQRRRHAPKSRLSGTPKHLTATNASFHQPFTPPYSPKMASFNEGVSASLTPKREYADFTSNISMLMHEHPGVSASKNVYVEFLDCLRSHPHDQQLFPLLSAYENVCYEQVVILRNLVRSAASHEHKFDQTLSTLKLLEQEHHTWKLLNSLYSHKLTSENADVTMVIGNTDEYKSDRMIADDLYKHNPFVTHAQLVIDWLESIATEEVEMRDTAPFVDKAIQWENTLHKLERKKTGNAMLGRQLITEMDPDAPFRQSGQLDDLDKEDESRLLKFLFVCIRAGQLDKAEELCIQCGQPWRAATFEGWRLHHDPNYNTLRSDGVLAPVEGNQMRDLWKLVCWRMAADPVVGAYEKAIYGSRSGNLRAMLAVCETWKDYVWAYYRVLVDRAIETELRLNYRSSRPLEELPSEYWQKGLEPEIIFKEIEATENEKVHQESKYWYPVIQKHIILMDFNALIEIFHMWLQTIRDGIPKHLLRFIVHIILFLRRVGQTAKDELCTPMIEAYVQFLISERNTSLIASYVKHLPSSVQVVAYAKFLQDIEDESERHHCLQLARDADLNVHSITKLVVENIRNETSLDFLGSLEPSIEQNISDEDEKKINAIDWLVFDEHQRIEALRQANAIMRSFIALRKTSACRQVFDKISLDSIAIIRRQWQQQSGLDELPPHLDSLVKEFLAISTYLDAMESFNHWFSFLHHDKPQPPPKPTSSQFTDQVAFEHRQKQYEIELERWRMTLDQYSKKTKDAMYNVLLFPQGWMMHLQDSDEDDGRYTQMARLRQLCLPQISVLLHTVLHKTGSYMECLRLADIIVSEDRRLYQEFHRDELQQLLELLRDSSISILSSDADPLGYSAYSNS